MVKNSCSLGNKKTVSKKELKAKIVNMKNRSNARRKKMGEMIEESINSSKKKKKKSKKKKKKKDSP